LCADKPATATLTALVADPQLSDPQKVETYAKLKDIKTVVIPNASHFIQHEFPEVIVEEALRSIEEYGNKEDIMS